MTNREQKFDILRGMAIWLILIAHSVDYVEGYPDWFVHVEGVSAFVGLGIFAFLSGMLLSKKYGGEETFPLKVFYLKRLRRLFVPYLGALTLFFFVFNQWGGHPGLDIQQPVKWWLVHVTMLQTLLHPWSEMSFTLWYVGFLLLAYCVFPLLQQPNLKRFCIAFSSIFAVLLGVHYLGGLMDARVLLYFPVFALGVSYQWIGKLFKKPKVLLWFGGVSMLLVCGATLPSVPSVVKEPMILVAVLALVVFVYERVVHLPWKRFYLDRFFVFSASGAYFKYLFHRPLLALDEYLSWWSDSLLAELCLYFIEGCVIMLLCYWLERLYYRVVSGGRSAS